MEKPQKEDLNTGIGSQDVKLIQETAVEAIASGIPFRYEYRAGKGDEGTDCLITSDREYPALKMLYDHIRKQKKSELKTEG